MNDDRIWCGDCAHLEQGRCTAERADVPSRYYPVTSLPRRCEFFDPRRGLVDRRSGRERFPLLWKAYRKWLAEHALT